MAELAMEYKTVADMIKIAIKQREDNDNINSNPRIQTELTILRSMLLTTSETGKVVEKYYDMQYCRDPNYTMQKAKKRKRYT